MQNVIVFIQAHQAVLAAVGVSVLDLIFALNPNAASNGILHWIFLQLGGKS